jgi:peptidoglycan/xylan/chitin deacetylase (PgdA/CDA1 family)
MKNLRIVYYHLIGDSSRYHYPKKFTISQKIFDSHIRYYKKYYEIITIDEAFNRFSNDYKFNKQLVITTDDGFEENYSCVRNILGNYNLKATFFIINDCVDNKKLMWRHALYIINEFVSKSKLNRVMMDFSESQKIFSPTKNESLMSWSLRAFSHKTKEKLIRELWESVMPFSLEDYLAKYSPYLSSNQIGTLIKEGHSIGSHSNTHPLFDKLSDEEAKKEIENSIKALSEKYKININSFSFPFGRCDRTTEIIKKNIEQIRVVLGIKEGLFSNSLNPLFWERTNMEYRTSNIRFRFNISPYRNTYLS